MVVAQWLALLPSTLMFRVQILLATNFFVLYNEKTKMNEKEAEVGPVKKRTRAICQMEALACEELLRGAQ